MMTITNREGYYMLWTGVYDSKRSRQELDNEPMMNKNRWESTRCIVKRKSQRELSHQVQPAGLDRHPYMRSKNNCNLSSTIRALERGRRIKIRSTAPCSETSSIGHWIRKTWLSVIPIWTIKLSTVWPEINAEQNNRREKRLGEKRNEKIRNIIFSQNRKRWSAACSWSPN